MVRKVYCCPYCSHPMAPPNVEDKLTAQQLRIFEALERAGQAGITRAQILEQIYFDNPSGGSENRNLLNVQKTLMTPALHHFGLKIVSTRSGNNYRWRLAAIAP
jgi:hypothetical protein